MASFDEEHQCADCGGITEEKHVTHYTTWQEELYIFENVPSRVCRNCGAVWFSGYVAETIDNVLNEKPNPTRHREVPVYPIDEFLEAPLQITP